jgi:hypothetical protein
MTQKRPIQRTNQEGRTIVAWQGDSARTARRMLRTTVASLCLALPLTPAAAQGGPAVVPNQTAGSSMINLILQLVKQGSISPANGTILIQEALNGGAPVMPGQAANAQAAQATAAPAPAYRGDKPLLRPVARVAAKPAQAPAPTSTLAALVPPPPPPGAEDFVPASAPVAPSPPAVAQAVAPPAPLPAPTVVAQAEPVVAAPVMAPPPPRPAATAVVAPPAAPVQPAAEPAQPLPVAPPAPPAPPAPSVVAPAAVVPPPPPPPTIRVSYVPESVRKQITEEVRKQVMEQAKTEGWAAPGDASPDWVRRITLSGDMRFRSQSDLFSSRNADDLFDYNAINATTGGADFTNPQNLTYLNLTQDRINRLRLRARLGLAAQISPQVAVGLRIASGDDPSPISTNQILGGGLTKKDLWLDQAYLKISPLDWADVRFGRFANPFAATNLLFDDDLNFDGGITEIRGDALLPDNVSLALRAGAFPLDLGGANFPNTETAKRKYPSKWLFSAELEAGFEPIDTISISGAAGFHVFSNIQGRLSDPCPFNGVNTDIPAGNGSKAADPIECSTDGTRAFSPRKGNTLFFIRDLYVPGIGGAADLVSTERQYLGLTYDYRVLDLTFALTAKLNGSGVKARLVSNFLRNMAYKHSDECRYGVGFGPLTNVTPLVDEDGDISDGNFCAGRGTLATGRNGWLVNLSVGHDKPKRWGEWRAQAGYRYLESDAVLDSLTESDFGLGGTNLKGYTASASFGLLNGLTLGGRWLSANEISGRPLSIDVLQVELQAEF